MARQSLAAVFLVLLTSCATRPVLYPNSRFKSAGKNQADQDIADCRKMAKEYVSSHKAGDIAGSTAAGAGVGAASGAAAGAIFGSAARGAAAGAAGGGAAGLVRGLFKAGQPKPVYKNFINHCLKERGYEVVGWQ